MENLDKFGQDEIRGDGKFGDGNSGTRGSFRRRIDVRNRFTRRRRLTAPAGSLAYRHRRERLAASHHYGVCYHAVPQVRSSTVRIDYDAEADTLRIVLKNTPVRKSEEERSGVILDYDATGQLVALEILDAATRLDTVDSVQLRVRHSSKLSDAAE